MMIIKCLGSGSKGNSYAIDDEKSVLLLEAGLKISVILNGYYEYLDRIVGCFVTHEHQDHAKSVIPLHNAGIPIYASKGTFESLNINTDSYGYYTVKAGTQCAVGSYVVLSWKAQHDCQEPLGFLIYSTVTHEKLLFATDTYFIPNRFVNLNYIMVECNYSEQILNDNIANGSINRTLAKRLRESHFSLENVKDFLLANDLTQCDEIYLIHLSGRNADRKQFKEEIQCLTGKIVTVL